MSNVIKDKSFSFAVRIVDLCSELQSGRREFVISKQLLRSGTAIGALVRESVHAESRADFIHKLAIARKEANETAYWIELLHASNYLPKSKFELLHQSATELLRLLTRIIKSSKLRKL